MDHIFIMDSLLYELLGCFKFQTIMKKEAMNMDDQISLLEGIESIGNVPKSGTALS